MFVKPQLAGTHQHPHLPVSLSRVVKSSGFQIPRGTTNPGTWGSKKHLKVAHVGL